jgi:hypothetical protein
MADLHDSPQCRCPHGGFDPAIFARAAALLDRRAFLTGLRVRVNTRGVQMVVDMR